MHEISVLRENSLECTIDWLSFTIFALHDVQSVLDAFGFDMADFFQSPKGAMGYKQMLLAHESTIRVLYDGNDNMGIHVDVSGCSIGTLYEHFMETLKVDTPFGRGIDIDKDVLIILFERIQALGQITRIDFAIDDYKPFFTLKQLDYIFDEKNHLYVSKWRTNRVVKQQESGKGITGYTLYAGRRDGDIMLRVYDKQLERAGADPEQEDKPWVRWELELKAAYANNAIQKLVYGLKTLEGNIDLNVGSLACGILSEYLRIIKNDDINRSRCSTDKRWIKFLDNVRNIRLYIPREETSIQQKKDWIFRQVAPTLSGIVLADFDNIIASYGDYSVLAQYILSQESRLKKGLQKQISAVNPNWKEDLEKLRFEAGEYGGN